MKDMANSLKDDWDVVIPGPYGMRFPPGILAVHSAGGNTT